MLNKRGDGMMLGIGVFRGVICIDKIIVGENMMYYDRDFWKYKKNEFRRRMREEYGWFIFSEV